MSASKLDISHWFDEGVGKGTTHMFVVCDTFELEDFPVYVEPGEDARAKAKPYEKGENMTRLMEVYHLGSDKQTQLDEHRAFHFDPI